MKFTVPSLLWVAIFMVLPPALVGFLDQWFPTNTYWWSALIVTLLNAAVLIIKVTWFDKAIEVEKKVSGAPAGTLSASQMTPDAAATAAVAVTNATVKERPFTFGEKVAKLLVFGA